MSAVISLGVSTVATPSPRSVLGSHIHLLRDKTPFDTQEILEPPKVTGWSAFSGWKCVKVAIFIGSSLIFSPSLPEQNPDLSPRPPLPCGCQVARRQWQALVAAVFFFGPAMGIDEKIVLKRCARNENGDSWQIPSGKLTSLWKITIFNGKIHYKVQFSIAMLVITRGYGVFHKPFRRESQHPW